MSGKTKRDKPWMFRTYAGHSTAKASNELYRKNLAKGQTRSPVAKSARSACRSPISAICAHFSTVSRSPR